MKRKINQVLNSIMGSFTGLFLGSGLYRYWHFQKYPDIYAMQSAPWYTRTLIQGFFTLVLVAICMIIKVTLIEKIEIMKKIVLIMGIIFLFLTVVGSSYVLINHGQVNAGYAVIPGVWTILCFAYYRSGKQ